MKRILIAACIAFLLGSAIPLLQAKEPEPTTRIVTDQKDGTFTFLIDNQAVAQLNRDGLYLTESLTVGGVVTDAGKNYVTQIIKQGGESHAQ